jgi:hypothetical protein
VEEWRVEGGGLWAVCGCEGLQVSIYHTEWYLSMIVWYHTKETRDERRVDFTVLVWWRISLSL